MSVLHRSKQFLKANSRRNCTGRSLKTHRIAVDVFIQIPRTPPIPIRISGAEPAQLCVIEAVAVVVQPGLGIEPAFGVGVRIVEVAATALDDEACIQYQQLTMPRSFGDTSLEREAMRQSSRRVSFAIRYGYVFPRTIGLLKQRPETRSPLQSIQAACKLPRFVD